MDSRGAGSRRLGCGLRPKIGSDYRQGIDGQALGGQGLAGQDAGQGRLGLGDRGSRLGQLLAMVRWLQLAHLQPLVVGNDQQHGQPIALPKQRVANRLKVEHGPGLSHGEKSSITGVALIEVIEISDRSERRDHLINCVHAGAIDAAFDNHRIALFQGGIIGI